MKVIWPLGQATVRDVYDALRARRTVAYTTVQTMMNILETKGHLKKEPGEKAQTYAPVRPQRLVVQSMVREFVNRVFDGSARPLLVHLLKEKGLTERERKQLQTPARQGGRMTLTCLEPRRLQHPARRARGGGAHHDAPPAGARAASLARLLAVGAWPRVFSCPLQDGRPNRRAGCSNRRRPSSRRSAPVTALAERGIDVTQWLLLAIAAGIVARLLWLGARLHPPARHHRARRPGAVARRDGRRTVRVTLGAAPRSPSPTRSAHPPRLACGARSSCCRAACSICRPRCSAR